MPHRRRRRSSFGLRCLQIAAVGLLLYAPPIIVAEIVEHVRVALR